VNRSLKTGTDNLVEDLECLTQSHLASTGKGELWFPLVRRPQHERLSRMAASHRFRPHQRVHSSVSAPNRSARRS
jgi:hypothetical protein